MLAIEATTFSGYGGLQRTDLPRPPVTRDRVLVRITAAGVTPLDYTILSGHHPRAKAPLVLGNEGAGVVEDAADSGLQVGSRVMFTGPSWLGVRNDSRRLVLSHQPDGSSRSERGDVFDGILVEGLVQLAGDVPDVSGEQRVGE